MSVKQSSYPIKHLCMSSLVRSNNPLVKNFKLSTSHEDFEFKKLLINTTVFLSRNPMINEVNFIFFLLKKIFSLKLMVNSRVILALLSYIEPLPREKTHVGKTFDWKTTQIEELQLHALAALAILLPRSLKEYFEYHIGTKLLLFYDWTINDGKEKQKKVLKLMRFCLFG